MPDLPDDDTYIDHLAVLLRRIAEMGPDDYRLATVKATLAVLREDETLRRALLEQA